MLCTLKWWLVTDILVQPIRPIVKRQSVKEKLATKYQSTLRNMAE
jgi:hypothetical protein